MSCPHEPQVVANSCSSSHPRLPRHSPVNAVLSAHADDAHATDGLLLTAEVASVSMAAPQRRSLLICSLVSLTGFFHGYDNGVVNGVFEMAPFRAHMGWPPSSEPDAQAPIVALQQGLTVNGFNGGAAVSSLLFGHYLVDLKGRRPALLLGSILFTAGGCIQAASATAGILIAGRIVAGVGVGLTSSAGTAYIAEVAPAPSRGAMVGMYQNNICIAIVLAAVVNWFMRALEFGWRVSLGLQVAMGLLVLIGLCFVPETPRFLAKRGDTAAAIRVLQSLRGDEAAARAELDGVVADLQGEAAAGEATWREILIENSAFRNVIVIGCMVQFAQIITGINAIVSFSSTMFAQLGVPGLSGALLPFVANLLANMLGSFVLVDRVGRRPILVVGMAGMALSLLVAGAVNAAGVPGGGSVAIACVILYMMCFGCSWGYGAWLYIPEIMPLRVRGKAVGLATFINWGPANLASAFLTPWMLQRKVLGAGGTLLFFGCIAAAVVPAAALFLPETKGQPLEDVLPMFAFSGLGGLRQFVRGNVAHGQGVKPPIVLQRVPSRTSTNTSRAAGAACRAAGGSSRPLPAEVTLESVVPGVSMEVVNTVVS